jgi:hypothetical protein
MEHRDETGKPCERHAIPTRARLIELAMIGLGARAFHHDAASKLQSLVMALDEVGELAQDSEPELRAAIELAQTSLRELHAMFDDNRGLSRVYRSRIALPELLARGAERMGIDLLGPIASCEVEVAVPAMTNALALLLDVAAGQREGVRAVELASSLQGGHVTLTLNGVEASQSSDVLSIATFVITRDGGELCCQGDKVVLRLPMAA